MKIRLLFAAVMVLACGGTALLAQDASPEQTKALSPAEAKKAKALEKRKADLIKSIQKQVTQAEKKLKPSAEQQEKLNSILTQYYVKRVPLVTNFRKSKDPEEKKVARREIRQLANKQEKALAEFLDEKQMKTLKRINQNDMEALNPPPAGGGGGGGGFGGGDGGGDGGGGDD